LSRQSIVIGPDVVEHYIRHGDRITFTFIVTDPVYLAEPLIRTTELIVGQV